ncbi:NADPH-dependent FMN reductase [Phytomonospora endophytica]|uniref:NAD(P)H-dependent FMN reductase n=1 Tax=Phytomonospora endophytica TaxID=714109 RepID=A0A841FUG7_9ACTN|nr:NAD(P)H-dependent oxidoreductase [Phytomonospora endophytica]MBB6037192.1 NAD(P)H-dependent FMN reductase [Phytomonospora endophytica]GIG71232.1 FMN reductase [Phytomonospora endophytica]
MTTRIAIVIGTTRPGRRSAAVAQWAHETAAGHPSVTGGEVAVDIVDIAEFGLPLLDEAVPAAWGQYANPHTLKWAETVASYDGFVFVTPEYNHAMPASLKNAVDYLFAEWNDKAAGFVSFGSALGVRAVEQLRLTLAELKVATVRTQVALSVYQDFEFTDPANPTDPGVVTPGEHHTETLHEMLGELAAWAGVLKGLRDTAAVAA